MLSLDSFRSDRHGATYLRVLEAEDAATRRLLGILNAPETELRLRHAEELGLPALAGIVPDVERDAAIVEALTSRNGIRFRQAVGVAVRLKMEDMGWRTTGRKGSLSRSTHFTKAEHYELLAG